jgi:hypothetical protein
MLAAILATLATASLAAAQGPPPPPDLPPPPTETETENPPAEEQPPEDQPPPEPEGEVPVDPIPVPDALALTGSTTLRGRMLTIGLSCPEDGRVIVSYRGKRAGSARFRCSQSTATARVRLNRRAARKIKRSTSGSLKIKVRAGEKAITRSLRFSRGSARLSAWPRGPHGYFNAVGYCDYDFDHGRVLYKFSGLLTSGVPNNKYWLRFWAYTYEGGGWQRMTDWLGPHENLPLEGQGGFRWANYDLFYPARKKWVAGYMEVWSYRHGKAFGDYLLTDQLGGGGITTTSGVWCYSQA